jgi:hypothetical protein
MQVGELFVSLGVKGSDKTLGAIGGVKKGLSETKSMSLETTAALLAVFYALDKIITASGRLGTSMANFNATTGDSRKEVQQWSYALKQAGGSGEEMVAGFRAVSQAIAKMKLENVAPEKMGLLNNLVGFDMKKATEKATGDAYTLRKLRDAMIKTDAATATALGKSFGLGETFVAAARRGKLSDAMLNSAPVLSDRVLNKNDSQHIALENVKDKFERGMSTLMANHGDELVHAIEKMSNSLLKIIEILTLIANKFGVFKGLGMAAEDLDQTVDNVKKEGIWSRAKVVGGAYSDIFQDMVGSVMPGGNMMTKAEMHKHAIETAPARAAARAARGHGVTNHTTINTKVTGIDPKDHHSVKQLHHQVLQKQVNQITKQSPVQAGGY